MVVWSGPGGAGPLAREFEPSSQSIRNWVTQADRDEGRRDDGMTTTERQELRWPRRENRRLREEREILANQGLVRSGDGAQEIYGFMRAHQALFHVTGAGPGQPPIRG